MRTQNHHIQGFWHLLSIWHWLSYFFRRYLSICSGITILPRVRWLAHGSCFVFHHCWCSVSYILITDWQRWQEIFLSGAYATLLVHLSAVKNVCAYYNKNDKAFFTSLLDCLKWICCPYSALILRFHLHLESCLRHTNNFYPLCLGLLVALLASGLWSSLNLTEKVTVLE